ncbi:MAG: OmpA family protein [Rudaea sp.]|uniref:OmpA family protein n=1 Tax=Rudaea sp. TaxID=2136325 RepID=UPI0039E48116
MRLLAAAVLLAVAGSAWAQKDDPDYDRLRGRLNQLADDRTLGALAPAEVALAEQALANLAEFGGKRKLHDHYVFLAAQRVDIAWAAAQSVAQERKLQALDREHDQILIAASRRDAEQARLELERQRIQSLAQQEETDRLRAEADEARTQSEQTSKQAETAKKQAAQARKLADAQAREAELARKEAELLAASGIKPVASTAPAAKVAAPITLGDAAFAPGKAALQPAGSAQIAKIATAAAGKSVRIEAYANDGGNAKANLALSQQRAQAIRAALVAAGVPAKRITAVGAGAKAGTARGAAASFFER